MNEQRYVKTYGDVEVMFNDEGHAYDLVVGDGAPAAVPAISEICEYVPKYLAQWTEKNGIKGMMELNRRQGIDPSPDDDKFNYDLIHKLGFSSDAIRDHRAAQGTIVHSAYRGWVMNGVVPNSKDYDAHVRGYIDSLSMFCNAMAAAKLETHLCEEPVASAQYGFAGTPDHFCTFTEPCLLQVGGNIGPNKRPKYEKFEAGIRPLVDLKTSKQVFPSHPVQLSGYELMLRELQLGEPTERWIVLIKDNGAGYNVKRQPDKLATFLAALAMYNAEKRPEGWMSRQTFVGLATRQQRLEVAA